MLDEFQDTSLMQWNNFKPLIKNSLASGNSNLVVGDVKQSIYRWRGSDWSLLNAEIYNDFGRDDIEESVLEENWRSYENIVNFNNKFFKYAANQCDILIGTVSLLRKFI
jgi:ATP-dependent exoDNAse (exonuclease V) beta subunit